MSTRLLALLSVLLLGLVACSSGEPLPTTGPIRSIDVAAAADRIAAEPELVIIDLRTPEEYADGHLEGATLINFYDDDFADRVAALDRDASYLIHCAVGGRSGSAGPIFADLGFTDVADMTAGYAGWVDAGLPVTTT